MSKLIDLPLLASLQNLEIDSASLSNPQKTKNRTRRPKMLGAVLIYSPRGELIVSKFYKNTLKRTVTDIFRIQVINSLDNRSPILTLGSTTFHYVKNKHDVWLVTVNRNNIDSAMVWEFLNSLNILLSVFGIDREEPLKEKFWIVLESLGVMLSEVGFILNTELNSVVSAVSAVPVRQLSAVTTEFDHSRSSMKFRGSTHGNGNGGNNAIDSSKGAVNHDPKKNSTMLSSGYGIPKLLKRASSTLGSQRRVSLPRSSTFTHGFGNIASLRQKNELVFTVNEKISILVSKDGAILKAFVDGAIDLDTHMVAINGKTVVCQFGLNDKTGREYEYEADDYDYEDDEDTIVSGISTKNVVTLEDCKFHECVDINKFQRDHVVQFTPVDGTIELMKYHVRDNLRLPFNVTPLVRVVSGNDNSLSLSSSPAAIDYQINLKSLFPSTLSARDVTLRIPVPPGTIDCKLSVSNGHCKFVPEENCMLWRFNKFNGSTENTLSAITVTTRDTTVQSLQHWSRPPISLQFELLMFNASGLAINYFKLLNSADTKTAKWIKYVLKAGSYEIRY